jgi:putative DNA primase/helicase
MTAAEIAAALVGSQRSGRWWRCVCPVHGSRTGRSATLALRDGDYGLIVHCHAGCSRHDILDELRRLRLIGNDQHRSSLAANDHAEDRREWERRIEIARRLWNAATEASGSPVVAYLGARYITTLPPPLSLRWVPSLRRPDGTSGAAMVARVDGHDGELIGLQRTYLDCDPGGIIWRRRDRAALGPIAGGAVRLGKLRPEVPLIVAEGIESALSASELAGWPAWAALSAGGIERLALPAEARDIIIAVDRDPTGTGEAAARAAAHRWVVDGRRVRLVIPDRVGADANDLLRELRDVAA